MAGLIDVAMLQVLVVLCVLNHIKEYLCSSTSKV